MSVLQSSANAPQIDLTTRSVRLAGGLSLPLCGLGSWQLDAPAVCSYLQSGGRLIDTASYYNNEAEVGQAVRDCGIPREEIIVQTKLWPSQYAQAEQAIATALDQLNIGYIDLMLLHHPGEHELEAYRAIERHIIAGDIRAAGLSNYYLKELPALLQHVDLPPVLVQNEIHPYYQEREVVAFIHKQGLAVQAYFPLGGRDHVRQILAEPQLAAIAAAHAVTPAQAVLRWHIQRGVLPIPGSGDPAHQRTNLTLWDFELSDEEMLQIAKLEQGRKYDWY